MTVVRMIPIGLLSLLASCAGFEVVPVEVDLSSLPPKDKALEILAAMPRQNAVPICRISELGITSSAFGGTPKRYTDLRALPGDWAYSYAIRPASNGTVIGQVAVTYRQEGFENLRGCFIYRRVIATEMPDAAISQMLPEVRKTLQALSSLGVKIDT